MVCLLSLTGKVFPARAGMNRPPDGRLGDHAGVPRASGDEPSNENKVQIEFECSPRERG